MTRVLAPAPAKSQAPVRRLSQPHDRDEREAERAANEVARGASVAGWSFASQPTVPPSVHRCAGPGKCSCPRCRAQAQTEQPSGPGSGLDAASRLFMETAFGHDFGSVRLHGDGRAAESARAARRARLHRRRGHRQRRGKAQRVDAVEPDAARARARARRPAPRVGRQVDGSPPGRQPGARACARRGCTGSSRGAGRASTRASRARAEAERWPRQLRRRRALPADGLAHGDEEGLLQLRQQREGVAVTGEEERLARRVHQAGREPVELQALPRPRRHVRGRAAAGRGERPGDPGHLQLSHGAEHQLHGRVPAEPRGHAPGNDGRPRRRGEPGPSAVRVRARVRPHARAAAHPLQPGRRRVLRHQRRGEVGHHGPRRRS